MSGKTDKQRIRALEGQVERLENAVALLTKARLTTRDGYYQAFPEPHPYEGIKRRVQRRIWDREEEAA